jgi:hypothetical protein
LLIAAGVLSVLALILALWVMRERGRQAGREALLQERAQLFEDRATSRALALQDQAQDLARVHSELDRVQSERDVIEGQFREFVAMLVKAGVLRPEVDPLVVSEDDLIYEVSGPVPEFPVNSERALALKALKHAAGREGPRSDRPFSRRYMVSDGPLARTQFETLPAALVAGEYLQVPETPRGDYPLTDKERVLLQAVRVGHFQCNIRYIMLH